MEKSKDPFGIWPQLTSQDGSHGARLQTQYNIDILWRWRVAREAPVDKNMGC